jgi:hypothetical protein
MSRTGGGGPEIKKASRRGDTLVYKNKTLLSAVDPVSGAERAAAQIPKQERSLYFCPSPLFGYGLDVLLGGITSDSAVLCAETDPALFSLAASSIDKGILENRRFALCGPDAGAESVCAAVRAKWGGRAFRRVIPLKLTGGWQLDEAAYDAMEAALKKDIALEWGNAMTLVKLGRRYALNAARNVPLIAKTAGPADFNFGSSAVLVLGAGPSLDPFLDKLASEFDCGKNLPFKIVCVDTALPVLAARGIKCGLAVILESQVWNQKDFIGLAGSAVPAAFDLSAYPAQARALKGPLLLFVTPWTELSFFRRLAVFGLPVLPPLGSVGLTAVCLALRLGTGKVVTAGIDFSFTLDRQHARGAPGHEAALESQNRFRGIIGGGAFREGVTGTISKSGGKVLSNPAMKNYRSLFERSFSATGRVYDIEGSGLPLGVQTLSAEEAIAVLREGASGGGGVKPELQICNSGGKSATVVADLQLKLRAFIDGEIAMLTELRAMLSGENSLDEERLVFLLNELDYLWAHFPDRAGKAGPASRNDESFLKRVRAEIDPFIKTWEVSRRESA